MPFLNYESLDAVEEEAFRRRPPYPWTAITAPLREKAYAALKAELPEVSHPAFERFVNVKRAHGQQSHDRYILHWRPGLSLPRVWQEFIAELEGPRYRAFLRRVLGITAEPILTFEWYYAWSGCSVSPHCDAKRKIATHIFYFVTEEEWPPEWGGDILILDDKKRFPAHSAPSFEALETAASLRAVGNASLLFARTDHSWHGVRPLTSPAGVLRKLFIVTVNANTWQVKWRRLRGKDPDGYRFRLSA
jgi:hypothetical protein